MAVLVETLKKQHTAIIETLAKAKTSGLVTAEGYQHLSVAKNTLISHLQKEDQELYPRLKQLAETDPNLHSTLDLFARDMERVTALAIQFFDKYDKVSTNNDFIQDVGTLIALLNFRISREETLLYKEYENRIA
jgi:hypothetical protein